MNKVFILQLDGVSGPVLDHALKENFMPFVKSLIARGWVKRDFFCGLPSTTPASQMSLLYGINDLIVGFWFAMKKEKKIFIPLSPYPMHYIEAIAQKRTRHALVRDGATVMSMFSGNAKESISISSMTARARNLFEIASFFRNPFRVLAFFMKLFVFFIIERMEHANAHGKKAPAATRVLHVMKRMMEEIIDGEMAYYFSKEMIKKGHPVIYANFTGYDEIAHLYGPYSRFAHYYLSMLDVYIAGCYKEIQTRDPSYECIVLSDHGQMDNMSYDRISGEKFTRAIQHIFPEASVVHPPMTINEELTSSADMSLFDSGNMTHVYLPRHEHKLTVDDVERVFPDFFNKISSLAGVECVLARTPSSPVVFIKGKRYQFSDSISELFPLLLKETKQLAVRSLSILMGAPYAGDALIIGTINKDSCVTLSDSAGVHGGIGGNQTASFCMSRAFSFDPQSIRDYADLNRALYAYIYEVEGRKNRIGQNQPSRDPNS